MQFLGRIALPVPPSASDFARDAVELSKVAQRPSPRLCAVLESLGVSQYLERLVRHGFDCWESMLDIHEDDFENLMVKLGHRRKLQKKIATSTKIMNIPPQCKDPEVRKRKSDKEHERSETRYGPHLQYLPDVNL
jgi:hypothetical protein